MNRHVKYASVMVGKALLATVLTCIVPVAFTVGLASASEQWHVRVIYMAMLFGGAWTFFTELASFFSTDLYEDEGKISIEDAMYVGWCLAVCINCKWEVWTIATVALLLVVLPFLPKGSNLRMRKLDAVLSMACIAFLFYKMI